MTRTATDMNSGPSGRRVSAPLANAHVHLPPNFSAFDDLSALVDGAAREGISVLGASNYFDFRVYRRFADLAAEARIAALFGTEIITLQEDLRAAGTLVNDPANPGRTYLCGKALMSFDKPGPEASALLDRIRRTSEERMAAMWDRLADHAGACLREVPPIESIIAGVAARSGVPLGWVSLQERHLARALQEAVFAEVQPERRGAVLERLLGVAVEARVAEDPVALQETVRSRLMKEGRPAFVPEAAVSFDDGYRLVLELGGIPCYPTLADGTSPICAFENPPEVLAQALLRRGVHCAELIPTRNAPEVVDRYVSTFRRAGILVLGGTEHNTQRMLPLTPACRGGVPLPEAAQASFWEAACVVAAHQHQRQTGQSGYVDADGQLAPGFADGEARIRWFRELGEEVIASAQSAVSWPSSPMAARVTTAAATRAQVLEGIAALSRRYGDDPQFSRAGGGNSSAKVDGVLYIKPSGAPLARLTSDALIGLEIGPLLDLLDGSQPAAAGGGSDQVMSAAAAARVGNDDGRRPSVELLFHALLPARYVLHTHPITVNALTCADRGRELAAELFGDRAVWVPYTDPGLPLARRIRNEIREHAARTGNSSPAALLLQNHGLVVAADDLDEIDRTSKWIVDLVAARLDEVRPGATTTELQGAAAAEVAGTAVDNEAADGPVLRPADRAAAVRVIGPTLRAALATGTRLSIVTFDDGPLAGKAANPALGVRFAAGGPLTPDQIVYSGSWPLILDPITRPIDEDTLGSEVMTAVRRFENEHGCKPNVVIVPDLGVFAAGTSIREAETARDVYLDSTRVALLADALGGVRPLDADQRGFIERWEAEQYRRQAAAGSARRGRVEGLVAIVTGAAQGFGLSIAADLVAQGAFVALADLNAAQARIEADSLNERLGPGRAVGIAVDVTDDASVSAMIEAVVRRFGGFDLLVSNAGILKAGSVMSQPVAEFDAVTRVNYRGYFLCVRNCAPILARQHRAAPAYWGDIVEINSKSGLAGSSRNGAYSGSKFGGIGLTQSFALELIADGIKVNAICPGNFLNGPLWSDPDNGLFVQYLREGKVPGAKTLEDVRHAYEAKVPMGRGCEPADVMEALYYVVAQRYETGQAIPVTGGQVMLS